MFNLLRWKAITISIVCLLSFYYSLPTLLPNSIQGKFAYLLPNDHVNLGLDLKGGASILLEVDAELYKREQRQYLLKELSSIIKNNGQFAEFNESNNNVEINFAVAPSKSTIKLVRKAFSDHGKIEVKGDTIIASFSKEGISALKDKLMSQTIEIIRRRVDETGTKEIEIQRQGDDYILLQVPGVEDPEAIKKILGKTAKLAFHLVDTSATNAWRKNREIVPGTKLLNSEFGPIAVKHQAELTGDMLENAQVTVQQNNPGVSIKLSNIGSQLFASLTKDHTKEQLAIVLDNKILSAPMINEPILSGNSFISGNFSIKTANELALLLRAGALPAPLKIAEERLVGPSLGADSISSGKLALLIGVILVALVMFLFYGFFGIIANFAMLINLFLLVSVLALFGATLTLPGIAGIVLTLGMSVDANVLIFERIKEEIKHGKTALSAIESGYNMALWTILDSNITTVIAAIIMYIMGSGPIKGFAVTLCMGIGCSMFTAITLTRIIIDSWYRRCRPKNLPL